MGRRWVLFPIGLALLAGAAAGWYLASPLFIRTTLVEERPVGLTLPVGQAPASAAESREPIEPAPGAGPAAPRPAGPVVIGAGRFSDRDQLHRGSGQAILARIPEGGHLLRFEEFAVTNGPDLHVLLSRTEGPTTHDEVYNGVYVGKLKASQGAFHYEIPAETDLTGIKSVVVYCVPFRVIFTSAPLAAT